MGPRCLIVALLVLLATAGDSKGSAPSTYGGVGAASSSSPGVSGTVIGAANIGAGGPSSSLNAIVEEPEFTEYIENVTVPAGRNVKLGCSVKNLGSYKKYFTGWLVAHSLVSGLTPPKGDAATASHRIVIPFGTPPKVAWMHFEQSAILTVHNHVITRNPRISVTHDKHDRHRTWYLHINNVHEEDKGRYMCQINTVTAKTQFGYLNVVVPPNIDDSLSSSDVIVREGSNISLRCRASGSPRPVIKWKRDDNSRITINKNYIVNEWEGDTLEITRISRLDMGAYLCIASNGVPPTVSKRIKVSVDFPPMLLIPHQLVGAPEGFNVTIECFTEAHPTSLNYWTRGEGPIIHDSLKYRVDSSIGVPIYKTHMKLTITNVGSGDDGIYKCVAKNPRGETDGIIRLYVSYPVTTPSSGLMTTETRWDGHYGQHPDSSRSIYTQDKNSRYQSNLNEIGLSEEKSSTDKSGVNHGSGGAFGSPAAKGDDLQEALSSFADRCHLPLHLLSCRVLFLLQLLPIAAFR